MSASVTGPEHEREFELLCATAWLPPGPRALLHLERVRAACQTGVDWERFLQLVVRHRVAPLVFATLQEAHAAVPPRLIEALRGRARQSRLRAMAQVAELGRIRGELQTGGIESIVLKGVVLSQQLHGDFSLRESCDMDVLVRPESIRQADAILRSAGYRLLSAPEGAFTDRQWRAMARSPCEFTYRHDKLGLELDLHRDPSVDTTDVEREELWASRAFVACSGTELIGIAPEPLLLYLMNHGGKHSWFRLKWLADLPMFLARPGFVDWERFLALTTKVHQQRSVALGALLAQRMFGLELPDEIVGCIEEDAGARWLMRRSLREIHKPEPDYDRTLFGPAADLATAALLSPAVPWRDLVLARGVTPKDGALLNIPPAFLPAYHLLRIPLAVHRRLRKQLHARFSAR